MEKIVEDLEKEQQVCDCSWSYWRDKFKEQRKIEVELRKGSRFTKNLEDYFKGVIL